MDKRMFLFLLSAVPSLAVDHPSHPDRELANVLREREDNLKRRADLIDKNVAGGLAENLSPSASVEARKALLAFRRDRAADIGEKIRIQQEIVQLCAQAAFNAEKRYKSGTGNALDCMNAKEWELEARQNLLEWQLRQEQEAAHRQASGPAPSGS